MKNKFEDLGGSEASPEVPSGDPGKFFQDLGGELETFVKNHPEASSRLPGFLRQSFVKAMAVIGLALMPTAGFSETVDSPVAHSSIGSGADTEDTSHGANPRPSLNFINKTSFHNVPFEVGVRATYASGVFVPDEYVPSSLGNLTPRKFTHDENIFSRIRSSAAIKTKEGSPLPVKFSTLSEIDSGASGTAWFVGGRGDFKLPRGESYQDETAFFVEGGEYLDLSSPKTRKRLPGDETKIGLQSNLQRFVPFSSPRGMASVSFQFGKQKGIALGYSFNFRKQKK